MSIAKKGSRRIVVDDVAYRWSVRRQGTYSDVYQALEKAAEGAPLRVAVELADTGGSVLVVETDQPRHFEFSQLPAGQILPSDVEVWIREAIEAGWTPAHPGAAFRLAGSTRHRPPTSTE
jgi:hypothetical protein